MEGDPGQDAAVGEYDITYKVTDSDQNTTTVIVKLLIYIPTPPILTVPSETMINPGEPFDPMAGVSA